MDDNSPRNYRIFFLKSALRTLAPPILITSATLHFLTTKLGFTLGLPLQILTYFVAIPLVLNVLNVLKDYRNAREAKRIGARTIPRVYGKWPGNVDLLFRYGKLSKERYYGEAFQDLLTQAGSNVVNMQVFGADRIFTNVETHVKTVLATGFEQFEKGAYQSVRLETLFGNGIFNRDGASWRMHRAMTRPFFARERISDFETFSKHAAEMTSILTNLAESSVPVVDMQDLYGRFTLDAATESLFGSNLGTLHGKLPVPGKALMGPKGSLGDDDFGTFAQAFEHAQTQISIRFRRGDLWPLFELIHEDSAADSKIIKAYITPLVREAIAKHAANKAKGVTVTAEETTLLGYLVANSSDEDLIRDELLNILLAGRDTTAALLTFTTYLLAMHPDVDRRLREEIIEFCGNGEATYEIVPKMKYMRAVLNETLRLFPPVPLNVRYSRGATTLPGEEPGSQPYYMPGNTALVWSSMLVHKRTDLWGEDAHEFNPDRWLDADKVAAFTANPFMFIPFNAGPRICLGQQFAYNEASFLLVALLPKFRFTLASEYQPQGSQPPKAWENQGGRAAIERCRPNNAVTIFVTGGLWVKVHKVEN